MVYCTINTFILKHGFGGNFFTNEKYNPFCSVYRINLNSISFCAESEAGLMDAGSKMNPLLTLEYIQTEHENRYFDRKSAKIRVADLAPLISAFANADGGTIVIGISDKKRTLEGIDSVGEDRINEFINAPKDCCKPMPDYKEEILQIINTEGKADRLFHFPSSSED